MDWTIVPAAFLLDAIVGDPRGLPHPTRAMGILAEKVEAPLRAIFPPLLAGILGWLALAGASVALALGLPYVLSAAAIALGAGSKSAAALAWIAKVWIVYASMAPRDLADHALRVAAALRSPDDPLERGRRAVSMIVGRDVSRLDERGVVRAAVESVAESACDGVCAPIFWALVAGPAGALAYRATNTLDSMWGHKNERYILFGRAAARIDDALNWVPARLAFAATVAAAFVLGLFAPRYYSGAHALRLGWRDRRKHESPNAAWLEAAFAGALGLRLGGDAWYGGELLAKATLGEASREPEIADVGRSVALMYAASALFTMIGVYISYVASITSA